MVELQVRIGGVVLLERVAGHERDTARLLDRLLHGGAGVDDVGGQVVDGVVDRRDRADLGQAEQEAADHFDVGHERALQRARPGDLEPVERRCMRRREIERPRAGPGPGGR
jgi:hypothetical protein